MEPQLYYENVLANSDISRWITQTSEEASASRTRKGYGINRDVDTECASKVSEVHCQEVERLGHLQIIERIVRAEAGRGIRATSDSLSRSLGSKLGTERRL